MIYMNIFHAKLGSRNVRSTMLQFDPKLQLALARHLCVSLALARHLAVRLALARHLGVRLALARHLGAILADIFSSLVPLFLTG